MRRSRRREALWLGALLTLAAAAPAPAAEVTDVVSSGDKDRPFGFHLGLGYEYLSKVASVRREHEGDAGQTAITLQRDLVYRQTTHRMPIRAEIGLYHDLALAIEVPLVLADSRTLEYDQRAGGACVFSGAGTNCVNADTSLSTNNQTTFTHADWNGDYGNSNYLLPAPGYDAIASAAGKAQTGPAAGSGLVFRGPNRGGSGNDLLDTVNLALRWAPLSQRRDDTKPTWLIAIEYRASVGNVMSFDRDRPDASHGVADGLDHFVVQTAVSRRFKYFDPYFHLWFDLPFVRRGDTLFFDLGAAAKNAQPQMAGGTRFGVELVPFERARDRLRLSIDVNARLDAHFEGRGYSEIWEMLASSPALGCNDASAAFNPSCSPSSIDPSTKAAWGGKTAYQGRPFSGITTIENFATLGGEIAVVLQAGRWVRLRAHLRYQRDQGHLVTADDVGRPSDGGARVASPSEFNPAYRPVINQLGRRYRVDDVDLLSTGLFAQVTF